MRARDMRGGEKPGHSQRRSASVRPGKSGDLAQERQSQIQAGDGPRTLTPAAILGLQRSAGNAVVARMLSESSHAQSPARLPVQRFTIYKPGDARYPTMEETGPTSSDRPEGDGQFFPRQKPYKATGKWVDSDNKPNIKYSTAPALQISDNFDLAVEDHVEAKCFYATENHIDKANESLEGNISFTAGSKKLTITLSGGEESELFQVLPKTKVEGETLEGLDVTTAQQCNAMAEEVTGQTSVDDRLDEKQRIALILDEVRGWGDKLTKRKWAGRLEKMTNKFIHGEIKKDEYLKFLDSIVFEFEKQGEKQPKKLERVIKRLRMNQYLATPRAGDVLATVSSMPHAQVVDKKTKGEQFFRYHFGGVVAASGDDYITMENYSREMGVGISSGDPLFFFKMYGSERTWHDAQMDTGSFFGAVISMKLT